VEHYLRLILIITIKRIYNHVTFLSLIFKKALLKLKTSAVFLHRRRLRSEDIIFYIPFTKCTGHLLNVPQHGYHGVVGRSGTARHRRHRHRDGRPHTGSRCNNKHEMTSWQTWHRHGWQTSNIGQTGCCCFFLPRFFFIGLFIILNGIFDKAMVSLTVLTIIIHVNIIEC